MVLRGQLAGGPHNQTLLSTTTHCLPLPEGGAVELLTPLPTPGRPPVRGAAPPPGEAVLGVVSLGAPTQPPIPPAAVRGAEPGRAGSSSPPHCSLLAWVQRPQTLLYAVLLHGRHPLPPAEEECLVWPRGRLWGRAAGPSSDKDVSFLLFRGRVTLL